jgi:hypothetical protein
MLGFSLNQAFDVLKPLAFMVLGMAVYAILIFNYYRFLARRDIFKLNLKRYKDAGDQGTRGFLHFILTIVIYPIVLCIWFTILAIVVGFVGKNQSSESIIFISLALVGTVRIAAYYKEDLSRDLAKMLPFVLLGIFIVDQPYFDYQASLTSIKGIAKEWHSMVYYFIFIFALEFLLKLKEVGGGTNSTKQ